VKLSSKTRRLWNKNVNGTRLSLFKNFDNTFEVVQSTDSGCYYYPYGILEEAIHVLRTLIHGAKIKTEW